MGNPFVHMELMSTDPDNAKSFFGKLFGWGLRDMTGGDGMTYTIIETGKNEYGVGGGIMKNPIPHAPSQWVPYMVVEDLKAYTDKAVALGAKLMKDVTIVPDMGSFTILSDAATGMFGLWKTDMPHPPA